MQQIRTAQCNGTNKNTQKSKQTAKTVEFERNVGKEQNNVSCMQING